MKLVVRSTLESGNYREAVFYQSRSQFHIEMLPKKCVLWLLVLYVSSGDAFVVESIVAGGLFSFSAYYVTPTIYCHFYECCGGKWIAPNFTGLQSTLRRRVYGQHLVTETVLKTVVGHLNNKSPSKALALSFNGWTGSGKNFVSKIIAEHIFREGMESKFVHQVIATHDYPHKSYVEFYKRKLKSFVIGSASQCSRSLFIFDEMDKMPVGLIDVLKPFLDHHPDIGGVDYRKNIFIFLSNTGGRRINEAALTNWEQGKKREDITIKQMDEIINLGAFNTKGAGFWHTTLIESNLIDYFIPFLPLERSHIKLCVKADLEEKGHPVTDSVLNSVADEMLYFPEDTKVFSKSGCKKVSAKVDYVMG